MKKNMGTADRVFRILIAIVIAGLFFANIISGIGAVILMVFAAILVVTSFIGSCPLYIPLGISTCKNEVKAS